MDELPALRVVAEYHERVWGGQRLKPSSPPVGEAWIVYEHNRVVSGSHSGRTLAELAGQYGAALLGEQVMHRFGIRFPLLIKLLDTDDWLSVQVHPNNEQAERLEGSNHFGKTEAWHILEAEPGAQLICGLKPGTTPEELRLAIRKEAVLDVAQYLPVKAGDTILVAAGTIHALGPGLLLYEIQQTSDITYRVFDWNRPQSAGRALHIDKSLAVADVEAQGGPVEVPSTVEGEPRTLVTCPYFTLDLLTGTRASVLDTLGQSFHAVTVTQGAARVAGAGWSERLARFESVVIPAVCGSYRVEFEDGARALVGRIPAS